MQIVGVDVFLHSLRHSADNKIQAHEIVHLFMYDLVNRLFFLITDPHMVHDLLAHAHRFGKLFQVKRKHRLLRKITHRHAAYVFQLYAKQRAAHHISVASFVDQKLYCRHYFRTLLHLVKENECVAGFQGRVCQCRQAQENVFGI